MFTYFDYYLLVGLPSFARDFIVSSVFMSLCPSISLSLCFYPSISLNLYPCVIRIKKVFQAIDHFPIHELNITKKLFFYLINDFNRCNLKRRLITFLACRGQSADVRAVLRSNIKNLFVVSIVNDFFNVVFINVVNVKIVFDVKKLFSTRTTGSGVRGCSSKRTQTVTKEGNYYKIWFVH